MRIGSAVLVTICVHVVQKFLSNPACFTLELKVSQGQAGTTPIVEGTCLQCRRKRALLDLETHGRRAGWHEFHWNPIVRTLDAKTVCRVTEVGIDFVNGLDASVVVEQ